jgi:putative nucleotidyltransferase-like protein
MRRGQTSLARAVTRRALLAAIGPRQDRLGSLLEDPDIAAAVDWEWLIERAATHRVAALVAARVERGGIAPHLPDSTRARLDGIRSAAAQRAAAAQRTLRELAAGLQSQAVAFLLIKGSILAELVYGDPEIRPFFDVDVIVRRDALPAAEGLLRSWGYRMEGPWPLLGRRPAPPVATDIAQDIARQFYLRVFHNLSYAPARGDGRRPIELHWNIVPRGRLRLRAEQLWVRTTTVSVAGIELQTLDAEASLIHLAVHALEAWFHGFRLLHLCDVAWTVARPTAGYGDLWQLADAWGAAYQLELALRLVDQLWSVPSARALLAGRRASAQMRASLRLAGTERVLIDRNIDAADPWPRRAAVELAWGLAVRGLRAKLGFSFARRIAVARWRLARWRTKQSRDGRH